MDHLDTVQVSQKTREWVYIKILLVKDIYFDNYVEINPIEPVCLVFLKYLVWRGWEVNYNSFKAIYLTIHQKRRELLYNLIFVSCRIYIEGNSFHLMKDGQALNQYFYLYLFCWSIYLLQY